MIKNGRTNGNGLKLNDYFEDFMNFLPFFTANIRRSFHICTFYNFKITFFVPPTVCSAFKRIFFGEKLLHCNCYSVFLNAQLSFSCARNYDAWNELRNKSRKKLFDEKIRDNLIFHQWKGKTNIKSEFF